MCGNQSVSYCVYLGEYYRVCGCMETRLCHTVFIWVNITVCVWVYENHSVSDRVYLGEYHNVTQCLYLLAFRCIYHTIRHRTCVLVYVILGYYTKLVL